jgi:hypothetical protein
MKINRSVAPRDFGAVERALSLNVHGDGAVSITSDQAGAHIEVSQGDDGSVAVQEVLANGDLGESITISTSAPPVDEQTDLKLVQG